MPNWCNNEIIIRHDDKQKLIEIKEATETTGICEFLIPPPDTPAYRDEYVNSQKELEDDPTWWRNIVDELNNKHVRLSKGDLDMILRKN